MWYLILVLVSVIYIIINVILTNQSMFEIYILRPILFLILAIITLIIASKEGLIVLKFKKIRDIKKGYSVTQAGLILGGFQVSLLIIIGLIFGFGKSPYSFVPIVIILNAFFIGSFLIGTELSRAYFIKKAKKQLRKNIAIIIVGTAFLYMFLSISLHEFSVLSFQNPGVALEFVGGTLIPIFAMNLLATYLCFLGGARASIAYMGVLISFEWFSPIGPNPHWIILALVTTIASAIGFMLLQDLKNLKI